MRAFLDRFVGNLSTSALMVSTFFWSWFDLVPFSPLLPAAAGVPANPLVLGISLLLGSLTLFAFAFSAGLRARALSPRFFAAMALACGSGGALGIYAGAVTGLAALSYAGAVLTGVFQGAGAVAVGCLATCQGKTNALIHIAACLPFNIVFVLLGMFLKPGAAVVLCAVLPLLSALSFKVFLERGTNARQLERVRAIPTHPNRRAAGAASTSTVGTAPRPRGLRGTESATQIALLLLITAAFGFVNCRIAFFEATALPGMYFDYASLVIRAVVAVWVFSAYVFRSRQPYPFLVTAMLLMAAGLFALWFIDPGATLARFAACALFCTGYAIFDLLIWAIIVILHHGSRMPLMRFLCLVYAFDELGNAAGALLGAALPEQAPLGIAFGVFAAALTALAVAVLNQRSAIQSGLHIVVIDEPAGEKTAPEQTLGRKVPGDAPAGATALHDRSTAGPLYPAATQPAAQTAAQSAAWPIAQPPAMQPPAVVTTVAARYFLTEREAVVLGLLLAGRSAPYIADELSVSLNTVKTHVRHIYAKLDVHNRQELLDLLHDLSLGADERR